MAALLEEQRLVKVRYRHGRLADELFACLLQSFTVRIGTQSTEHLLAIDYSEEVMRVRRVMHGLAS